MSAAEEGQFREIEENKRLSRLSKRNRTKVGQNYLLLLELFTKGVLAIYIEEVLTRTIWCLLLESWSFPIISKSIWSFRETELKDARSSKTAAKK